MTGLELNLATQMCKQQWAKDAPLGGHKAQYDLATGAPANPESVVFLKRCPISSYRGMS